MSIYDTHVPAQGGGNLYLRLKDGESVKVRIYSEPVIFESKSERDGKEILSTRYGWLVWNQDIQVAQIIQQSATFFKDIAALAQDEEWGDPTSYDVKITRHGSGFNDTTYTVTPSANREMLSAETRAILNDVNLIDKIGASPFAQYVFWLSEFEKSETKKSEKPKTGYDRAKEQAGKLKESKKEDIVIEDIGDEPVNLDDIPF